MTLVIDDTTPGDEGLMNRFGAIAHALELLNQARDPATGGSWAEAVDDVFDQFVGVAPDVLATITPLTAARDAGGRGNDVLAKALRTAVESLFIKMTDDVAPLPSRTIGEALLAAIAAFKAGSYKLEANTLAASVTQTDLAGSGKVVVSTLDGLGYPIEGLLAETLRIRVVDTSTPGAEVLQILGEAAESDKLSQRWPKGSGSTGRFTSVAAGNDGILTNGTFETFTVANTPDGWTLAVGAAGTAFLSEASTVYEGSKSLKLVGNGSTLHQLKQQLTLAAQTNYAFVSAIKLSAAPATGVLTFDLHNGSGVIVDEAGNNQTVNIDLTALGTTDWVLVAFVGRLPDPVPAAVSLRIHCSTAIETGKNLFLDSVRAIAMKQPSGGDSANTPFAAVASGAAPWSIDDGAADGETVFTITATNARESKLHTYLERFLDLAAKGLRFPTDGSNLVDDALIA